MFEFDHHPLQKFISNPSKKIFESQILKLNSNYKLKIPLALHAGSTVEEVVDEQISPPFSTNWSNSHHNVLAFGNEEGNLHIMKSIESDITGDSIEDDNESLSIVSKWAAHKNAIFDVAWRPDDRWICTASADTTCKMWDVERKAITCELKGHNASIKSVAFDHLNPHIVASGGRDNNIFIWDTRFENIISEEGWSQPNPISTGMYAHGEQLKPKKKRASFALTATVTSLLFLKNGLSTLVSTGASDSTIKYWDIRYSMKKPIAAYDPVYHGKKTFGYNCIKLNPTGDRLYAAGSNNYIYEFDSNSLVQTNSYSNPKYESNSFYIKIDISVCGNFLASGSKDGDVYLWQVQDPLQQAVLKGHRAEVSCVSWSKKEHKLSTCSDDMSVRIWRSSHPNSEKKNLDPYYGFAEKVELPTEFLEQYQNSKHDELSRKETNFQSKIDSMIMIPIPSDKENESPRASLTPKKRELSTAIDVESDNVQETSSASSKLKKSHSSTFSCRKIKQSTSILNFFSRLPKK